MGLTGPILRGAHGAHRPYIEGWGSSLVTGGYQAVLHINGVKMDRTWLMKYF